MDRAEYNRLSLFLPFSLPAFLSLSLFLSGSYRGFQLGGFPALSGSIFGNPPKMRPSSCSPARSLSPCFPPLFPYVAPNPTFIRIYPRFIRTSSFSHPFAFPDILVSAAKREVFRVSGFARSFAWALFLPTVAVGQNKGNTHSLDFTVVCTIDGSLISPRLVWLESTLPQT